MTGTVAFGACENPVSHPATPSKVSAAGGSDACDSFAKLGISFEIAHILQDG